MSCGCNKGAPVGSYGVTSIEYSRRAAPRRATSLRGLGEMFAAFGDASLAPPSSVTSLLQSTYNDAVNWWNTTKPQLDPSSVGAGLIFPLDYSATQLDFNTGYGAQLTKGTFAWSNYRDALDGFIKGIISARSQSGFDVTVDNDPVAGWYYYTVTPKFATLPALWAAGTAGQTAGDVGGAALGALPWWVWAGGAAVVGLFLLTETRGVRAATAGYAGFRRRRRGHGSRRR